MADAMASTPSTSTSDGGVEGAKEEKRPPHLYQLTEEKELRLKTLYKQLDVDANGKIDIKDLTQAIRKHMPNIPETSGYAKQILDQANTSNDDAIDFSEFVHYILEHEKQLAVTFSGVDCNRDGYIDAREVKNYLHSLGMLDVTDKDADRIIKKMTVDETKAISLEEFQRYFLLHPSSSGAEIAKHWRRTLYIDIGEEAVVPEGIELGGWWKHLLAGGAAGAISRTSTAPLDRLKIFLQVYASRANGYRVVTSLRFLLKEGGLKALWRGNGVNVIKIIPESAIKFAIYEQAKIFLKGHRSSHELSVVERFVAGSFAGAVSQTAVYPLEVLKTRLALRKTGEMNRGMLDAFRTIWRKEGLRAFGRGYFPNMLGIIPYAGTDLAVYETLKSLCIRRYSENQDPGLFVLLGCGMLSSSCGQLVSYPLALVRTRLQAHAVPLAAAQPETMVGQFSYILRQEGLTGLYRGLTPNFMKVLPAVGISYVVYESVRKRLGAVMT